jgi:nucleoside-diphosphate-sugar epimerase
MTDTSHAWQGRPCLVTGGAGFGGSHLCAELLRREAKIYVFDRVLPRNSYLVLQGLQNRVEFIPGDVRDLELLRLTIERYEIDSIFHLAAQPLAPMSNVLPFETLSVNALGTYAVLEAMRTTKSASTLVFASSGAHYGATTTDKAIAEDDALCPAVNLYGPSKTAADVAVRTYASVYGLGAAVCRFMNTYGPGDTNFSRIVPRAIRSLLQNAAYDFGERDDGSTRLDFLHIRDMTNAYIRVAENIATVRGEAFNFGRGQPVSTGDIARVVSRVFDGREREPIFLGAKREKPVVKYLDIHKAKQQLGWQPETSLEQGIGETIDWYRRYLTDL